MEWSSLPIDMHWAVLETIHQEQMNSWKAMRSWPNSNRCADRTAKTMEGAHRRGQEVPCETVLLWLVHGCRDRRVDYNTRFLFQLAVKHRSITLAQKLLDHPFFDPSLVNPVTALLSHPDIYRLLLRDNRWSLQKSSARKIFFIAAQRRYEDVICDLAQRQMIHISWVQLCLSDLVKGLEMFKSIRSVSGYVMEDSHFRIATQDGVPSVVQFLLDEEGCDPAMEGNLPICSNDPNIVDMLLDYEVDPSVRDNYPLVNAVARGAISLVERLLRDDRVDPNAGAHVCADICIAKMLLDREDFHRRRELLESCVRRGGGRDMMELFLGDGKMHWKAEDWGRIVWKVAVHEDEEALAVLARETSMAYVIAHHIRSGGRMMRL
ncbi:hypothetical protein PROFUN_05266 [Planoprotostelium fungivorum]|uniref:Ankyrin n=1 Tax=Planoprotostelium fungivorum TaxID=1890364 RepID=A0A2P6NRA1_9EUKA|nr:hypothetical protein PROFUN_05266 [Planoprotostelium fungivorum]